MKILAVSDRVVDHIYCSNLRQKYPDIDLVVGCGDLPLYYLDFLFSALEAPLVYVRGNHDKAEQYLADNRVITEIEGATNLHGRTANIEGHLLAGLEGSMRYRPNRPYMYTESEMRGQIAKLIPRLLLNRQRYGRYLDVLVTHSPPFGIHDKPDLPHTGFKVFLTFMQLFKPRHLLHGHIHIYRQDTITETKHLNTIVTNVYPYKVLEIE
ncbi:MAG: metallophosphoesterase [Anaerolineales bacterium]|nr:metallophosphoesterase [Anaerolineales bacterium]